MIIEIGDGDGYLYQDRKDKNVIVKVDGKNLILPVDYTLAQLAELVKNMPIVLKQKNLGPLEMGAGQVIPHAASDDVIPSNPNRIEEFDTVEFVGPTDPEAKAELEKTNSLLVIGRLYRVLEVGGSQVDLIDDAAPVKMRLVVQRSWVKISKKHPPYIFHEVVQKYEITYTCECGKILALVKDNETDIYEGKCLCGLEHKVPAADIKNVISVKLAGDGMKNEDINPLNPKIVLKLK